MPEGFLSLPYPDLLPSDRSQIRAAVEACSWDGDFSRPFDHASDDDSAAPDRAADESGTDGNDRCSEYVEHDRYFQVRRLRSQPAETFLRGLIQAHALVYRNAQQMGVTIVDPTQWRQLFAGMDNLMAYAGRPRAAGAPAMPPAHVDGYQPEQRWLVGHQFFFAVLQGTIVGLNCFLRAVERGDDPGSRAAVRLASAFMRSSSAAIRFTADFGPVDYDLLVRPAMAPPAVRVGFSGLQTRDHALLVELFAKLRVIVDGPGVSGDGAAFEEFVDATIHAYEAHQFICARFGGDVLPSLRMAANSQGRSNQPGAVALRQIMRARLFTLTGCAGPGGAG